MATEIWVNIGSGNGLLPNSTKPLPEPMLTDHQWKSSDIHIRAISQEMPQPSVIEIRLKITYLKFNSNFLGANELYEIQHHRVYKIMTPDDQAYIVWSQIYPHKTHDTAY